MEVYQAKEIMEAVQIGRNRFDYIVKKVGVTANIKKAAGRGSTNLYSYADLLCFAIANTLLRSGFQYQTTNRMIEKLKSLNAKENKNFFNINSKVETGISINIDADPTVNNDLIEASCFYLSEHKTEDGRDGEALDSDHQFSHYGKYFERLDLETGPTCVHIQIALDNIKAYLNTRIKK